MSSPPAAHPRDVDPFPAQARAVAARWDGAAHIKHVVNGGNVVYRLGQGDQVRYLRLTDAALRTPDENEAECAFLRYLAHQDVAVSVPLPSRDGRFVERLAHNGRPWSASLFTAAPGDLVNADHPAWGPPFWRAWGAALGAVHRAAAAYEPTTDHRRWQWKEEFWLREADRLLPPDDARARAEWATLRATLDQLPRDRAVYGLTHGDFAPANFRYVPDTGRLTAFDFGNAGYHWYMWDVAVSLSIAYWSPPAERVAFRRRFVAGYREAWPLPEESLAQLDWFLRLRMLYVYLSRLWWFGPRPTPPQQKVVDRLQALVHAPVTWERVTAPSWREA